MEPWNIVFDARHFMQNWQNKKETKLFGNKIFHLTLLDHHFHIG